MREKEHKKLALLKNLSTIVEGFGLSLKGASGRLQFHLHGSVQR
jgi:hypothetical protein